MTVGGGGGGGTGNHVTSLEWSGPDETWWEEQAQVLGTSLTEPDWIHALWGESEGVSGIPVLRSYGTSRCSRTMKLGRYTMDSDKITWKYSLARSDHRGGREGSRNPEFSDMHNFRTGDRIVMKLDIWKDLMSQMFCFESGPNPMNMGGGSEWGTGNHVTRLQRSDRDETWWEEQKQSLGSSLTEPDRIRALQGELDWGSGVTELSYFQMF